jgi:hypothetical protein
MNVVSIELATQFWTAVDECLVQFHGLERNQAAKKVARLRSQLAQDAALDVGEPSFDDLIYHAEPWYIACDLAGAELPLDGHWLAYESLLRHIEQRSN